ncbi:DUF421 domain-containing protein [Peribacillus deserti]|uniref:YetF C-terminal domain-containing protein n=1 Tax=Peribacillus deserti TaxID=673318 RepID=A0A2N5M6E8_9BACI|nr:DUF421 domain-containing protein [Peribacillus deserti]PLT29915.1 hypothetical protein CUU66_10300 [Peribacillus deserti]
MEYIYKPVVIFIVGYLLLRLSGKSTVSQLHSFDLLFILILGNVISEPLEDTNILKALAYSAVIVILYKIFARLALQNQLRWILYESPTVLIRNGDIDREGLKKVRMPLDELLAQLRIKGYADTSQIAIALMEDTGSISVIPKSDYRPVQPADLDKKVKEAYIPIPLIMDGQIMNHNLKYLKLHRDWLYKKLQKHGLKVDEIMLATYSQNGQLSIDDNKFKGHKNDPNYYKPGENN